MGLLLIPYYIETLQIFYTQALTWQIVSVTVGFLFNKKLHSIIYETFIQNKKILRFFLFFNCLLIVFSSTVPWNIQFLKLIDEFLILFIILLTYQYSQKDFLFVKSLTKYLIIALLINFVFTIYFELILKFNPTGQPLYLLLGIADSGFTVDMIDSARGVLNMRVQSITGHPLSYGQYLLIFLPLFMLQSNKRKTIAKIMIYLITLIVLLTGTRGAIFPLFIIWIYYFINNKPSATIQRVLFIIISIVLLIQLLPTKYQNNINNIANTFQTYIYFWDDNLQAKQSIEGSSMQMRFEQFAAAQKEIENNPLFGRGKWYSGYFQIKYKGLHPILLGYESFALLILVEQGWLGIFLFLYMHWLLYKKFSQKIRWRSFLTITFIAILLSELMTGIRPFSFLILGLTAILINYYEKEPLIKTTNLCKK